MNRWLRLAPVVGGIMIVGGLTLIVLHLRYNRAFFGVNPAEVACVAVGLALFLTLFMRGIKRNVSEYASHTLTVVFLALLLMTIFEIVQNHSPRWDLTRAKIHSLSPQAIRFLREMEQPAHLTVFVPTPEKRATDGFIRKFASETPLLTYDIADPEIDRATALHITQGQADVKLAYDEAYAIVYDPQSENEPRLQRKILRKAKAAELDEESIVNAIALAQSERKRILCYLTGHDEPSLEPAADPDGRSVSTLKGELTERGFELKPLNVAHAGVVPEDCEALLCIGPQMDIAPVERSILQDWIDEGGKAIVMLNPMISKTERLDQFGELLLRYGVRAQVDQVVLDLKMGNRDANYAAFRITSINESPLTRGIRQNFAVMWTMPLSPGPTAAMFNYEEMVFSSEQSFSALVPAWLAGKVQPPKNKEDYHPFALAAAVSKNIDGDRGVKLFVMGDGECLLDGARIEQPQLALVVNSLNWMLAGDRQISIPPVKTPNTPASFTLGQMRVTMLVSMVLLPCGLLFGGFGLTMLRRRVR